MAHLEDPRVEDREALLERAATAGVTDVINASFDPDRALPALSTDVRVHRCTGLHPMAIDAERWRDQLDAVTNALPERVALGEIGVDDREEAPAMDLQREVFERQLSIARIQEKSIIVHCVRAWGPLMESLERFWPLKGIVHGYGGAPELLERISRVGLVPSFGGSVTHDHFKKARSSACVAQRFCVESDTPDHPPHGRDRSEPSSLPATVAVLAELRGEDPATVRETSTQVAREVFGLAEP